MINIPNSIFPTNADGKSVCFKCKKPIKACQCKELDPIKSKLDKCVPILRLDKSGRKGKTVTLIEGLPRDKGYLSILAKKLKSKTGSGGTFYLTEKSGTIEIQGDQQNIVRNVLKI